jgi:fumarate hydratase class II
VKNNNYRIEFDSLGEVRVPANTLYGAQTECAMENFPISGLRPRRAFIWSMAIIKRAAAEVNSGAQLVKVALATQRSVRETALEKAAAGELIHRDENRLVSIDEIKSAFIDLHRLTEGGVVK